MLGFFLPLFSPSPHILPLHNLVGHYNSFHSLSAYYVPTLLMYICNKARTCKIDYHSHFTDETQKAYIRKVSQDHITLKKLTQYLKTKSFSLQIQSSSHKTCYIIYLTFIASLFYIVFIFLHPLNQRLSFSKSFDQ